MNNSQRIDLVRHYNRKAPRLAARAGRHAHARFWREADIGGIMERS